MAKSVQVFREVEIIYGKENIIKKLKHVQILIFFS